MIPFVAPFLLLLLRSCIASIDKLGIPVWHVTDPHTDPFYTPGVPAEGCYCRAHEKCPARPSSSSCAIRSASNNTAGTFGNAEADCETPQLVLDSALQQAQRVQPSVPFVIHGGDFCAYMLETPCNNSAPDDPLEQGSSKYGLLSCLRNGYSNVRTAFPKSLVLPVLGNHDTVVLPYGKGKSGAVFAGSAEMKWLYETIAKQWGTPESIGCVRTRTSGAASNFSCAEAQRTLLLGGYYATRLRSYILRASQGADESDGVNVTVLGLNTNYWSAESNPAVADTSGEPYAIGEGMFEWALQHIKDAAGRGDKVLVLGHIPPYEQMWSSGLYRKWVTALEPYYRLNMQLVHFFGHMHHDEWMTVRACEPSDANNSISTSHELRVGETDADKSECAGEPLGLMVTVPSISYAYPAANPAVRLLEFSPTDFSLFDMYTYTADLHSANIKGQLEWGLEYSFADTFGSLSPKGMSSLVGRMAEDSSHEWKKYRGDAAGTLYCKGWLEDLGKADSHCAQACQGDCKKLWLRVLNGTGITIPSKGLRRGEQELQYEMLV